MKQISIVIPAFNEAAYIGQLLESIDSIEYPKNMVEVIVVNDGSNDATAQIVKTYPNVRLVDLPANVGRYECRKKGAETAGFSNLLFVDAHSLVEPNILRVLDQLNKKVVIGRVEDVEPLGTFDTFYRAMRRLLFPAYYKNAAPFILSPENFDGMPKGTGVLFIEKEILFSAYCDLNEEDMGREASDDTKLLRAIVTHQPILSHPDVKIKYFSRASIRSSIKHLYERGPKFVDYYLNPSLRNFWLVIVFPLLMLTLALLGLIFLPFPLLSKIAGAVAVVLLATFVLARSMREFLIIFWVMPVSIAVFYAGIIRGITMKLQSQSKAKRVGE